MKVFQVKSTKGASSEDRLVGFHLKPEEDSKIALYAIAKGVSKSSLLRQKMEKFIRGINPVDELAKKAVDLYATVEMGEVSFIQAMKDDMRSRSIKEDVVLNVINRFKEVKKKKDAESKKQSSRRRRR